MVTSGAPAGTRPAQVDLWLSTAPGSGNGTVACILGPEERRRAAAYRTAAARRSFIQGRVLLRTVLARYAGTSPAALAFGNVCRHCGGNHGKPVLLDPPLSLDFNLSRSGDAVAIAVSRDATVGIDIEHPARTAALVGLRSRILSRRELEAPIQWSDEALARHWTRKEAVLKATGHGLGVDPSELTLERGAGLLWRISAAPHLTDAAAWSVIDFGHRGHFGAMAVRGRLGRLPA